MRPGFHLGNQFACSPNLLTKAGSLNQARTPWTAHLTSQSALGISPLKAGIAGGPSHLPSMHMGVGDSNSCPHVCHLPSPHLCHLKQSLWYCHKGNRKPVLLIEVVHLLCKPGNLVGHCCFEFRKVTGSLSVAGAAACSKRGLYRHAILIYLFLALL